MASGSLGSLVVSLAVDTAKFQGDLGRAAVVAERRMKNIRDTASRALGAVAIAAAAAGVGLTAMLGRSLRDADAMLKLARATGTTVESLSALRYAANLSGVSQDELGVALKKLATTAVDAAGGVAASAAAFKALGVEVRRANGSLKSTDELVAEIADAFAAAPDSITKTAIATDIFGKSGAKMIPLLNEGANGLKRFADEAGRAALIIGTDTAEAAERFNDNLERLKLAGQSFGNLLAEDLANSLSNFSAELVASADGMDLLRDAAHFVGNILRGLLTIVEVVRFALSELGDSIGGLAAATAAAARGEFRAAWDLLGQISEDGRLNLEREITRILDIWDDTAQQTFVAAPKLGAELASPAVEAAKQSKAAIEEMERYATQDIWGRQQEIRLEAPLGPSLQENAAAAAEYFQTINRENIQATERTVQLGAAFEEAEKSAKGLMATIEDEVARQSFVTIRDLIYDFSNGADRFGQRMLDAIRSILADQATRQLFGWFDSLGSGSSGGGGFLSAIGSAIGSLFGRTGSSGSGGGGGGGGLPGFRGFAANGMTLRPGEFAIAGEAGPEPVFGGTSGATIVPMPKLQAQRNVTIAPVFAPAIHIDSRTDRAAVQADTERTIRTAFAEYHDYFRDQVSRGAFAS